ncbi:MAG: hypothetical protein F6K31_24460 [Symploca sp. SIO2G7]|nr:hypothetical protein [Symploca sp. SIO2G7]
MTLAAAIFSNNYDKLTKIIVHLSGLKLLGQSLNSGWVTKLTESLAIPQLKEIDYMRLAIAVAVNDRIYRFSLFGLGNISDQLRWCCRRSRDRLTFTSSFRRVC